jgi:hypothetical protein
VGVGGEERYALTAATTGPVTLPAA